MSKVRWSAMVGFYLLIAVFYLLLMYFLFLHYGSQVQLYKVGILTANEERLLKVQGLKENLESFRYQEGENIDYIIMNAQTNMDLLPRYAKSLVDLKPDVIVATGTAEADALKEITSQMKTPPPVIFMGILSPAKLGLADNITKPSGNLTGLDNYYLELLPKRLQLFHSLIPNIETIAVLGDKRILAYEEIQKTLLQVVEELPIDAEMVTVSTTQEIEEIFKDMGEKGNGGILLLPGFFIETSWEEIIMQANEKNIPIFGLYPQDAEKGCLASYGTSYYDQGAQSAEMLDKVLRGVKVQDIPIETPDQLDFVINLGTARKLGIELSPEILSFADQVLE